MLASIVLSYICEISNEYQAKMSMVDSVWLSVRGGGGGGGEVAYSVSNQKVWKLWGWDGEALGLGRGSARIGGRKLLVWEGELWGWEEEASRLGERKFLDWEGELWGWGKLWGWEREGLGLEEKVLALERGSSEVGRKKGLGLGSGGALGLKVGV